MERILRLAGLPTDKDRDDFVFIVLREQTPDKRKQIIGYMLENMPDVGLLIPLVQMQYSMDMQVISA